MALSIDRVSSAGAGSGSTAGTTALAGDVGKLQIVFIQCSGTLTITPPTGRGWLTAYNNNPSRRCGVFYRVCPDTTADTFTLSSSSQVVIIALYISGFDATTPIPVADGAGNSGNVSSLALPTLTPTKANSLRIDFYTDVRTATPFPVPSPPAGQTTQGTNTPTASANYGLAIGSEALSTATATGTRTATVSTASPMDGAAIIVSPVTTDYTAAPADTVGLTGATALVRGSNPATDPVGITGATTLGRGSKPADTVGLTDAVATLMNPPVATLVDAFHTADATKWTYSAAASVSNGQLVLTSNTSFSGAITSARKYTLSGSQAAVRAASVTPANDASNETYFMLFTDDANQNSVGFDKISTNLRFLSRVGGVQTVLASVPYDPVAHRWWQFKESSGNVLYQTSPDAKTWTTQATVTPTINIGALTVLLGCGDSATPTGGAVFDSFNVPAAVTVTDNFSTLDTTKWSIDRPGNASVSGGRLALLADPSSVNLNNTQDVDLTDSSVSGQLLLPLPSSTAEVFEFYLVVIDRQNGQNSFWVDVRNDPIGTSAYTLLAMGTEGSTSQVTYGSTALPTGVPWVLLRLRHSSAANTVYFEYSTDGFSWTLIGSRVGPPFDISQMFFQIGALTWGYSSGAITGTFLFDNLNLGVYSVTKADTVGITGAVSVTQANQRTVADSVGITDAEAIFGQLTQVITTTAEPDIEARGVPLTDVANLSGTAGLTLDASPAPDLVVGPQRANIVVDAGSTELTHVVALSGTAGLELASHPRLRVVHRMTDILSEQVVGVIQPMTLTNGPAAASSRADDFSSLDPAKWFIGGTAAVSHGQLVLPCLLDYSAQISSLQPFSLLGSSRTVQLVQAAAPGAGSTNTSTDSLFFISANTADINHNVVGFYAENGTLWARYALSGGFTDVSLGAFTNGVWLRLRETGGTVYWETSVDTVTWTTRMTLPTASVFNLSTAYVTLMSGFFQVGVVNPTPAIFDNLDILPRFGGPSGAVGPTDRPAWRITAGDPYGSAVRTSAPAAWWRLRGNGNDELGGAAGQPIKVTDGTPATPYYGPAIVGSGQSLQIIWSDTVVLHVPDEPATRLAVPMTMEGWLVYSSTLGEMWGGAFGNPDFLIEHHNRNFAAFTRTDTDEFGSTSIVNDTAYHVAAVWSGTDVRLYVNGVLETNGWPFAISTYPAAPRTTGFQIGYWTINSSSGSSQPFIGSIQDVAVYPRALSAAEVHAHYQAGLVAASGDLAANIFDDIPVATALTASVWMRASAPTTVVLDVADAAGARLIGGPWSKVLADTGWHQWTQTFTTTADWVKNVHALRAPLPAGVDWIEWSDPTVTVTTPRSLAAVPKPEPEQPTPRRLSRVFTVLR